MNLIGPDGQRVYLEASALPLGKITQVKCAACGEKVHFITSIGTSTTFDPLSHCPACSRKKG